MFTDIGSYDLSRDSFRSFVWFLFFFFNDTATTEIYTLSLHDALPISAPAIRQIWDSIYGLEGHPPALKNGQLPAAPTINSAGRVVQTAAEIGPGQSQPDLAGLAAMPGQAADIEPGGRRALGGPG